MLCTTENNQFVGVKNLKHKRKCTKLDHSLTNVQGDLHVLEVHLFKISISKETIRRTALDRCCNLLSTFNSHWFPRSWACSTTNMKSSVPFRPLLVKFFWGCKPWEHFSWPLYQSIFSRISILTCYAQINKGTCLVFSILFIDGLDTVATWVGHWGCEDHQLILQCYGSV